MLVYACLCEYFFFFFFHFAFVLLNIFFFFKCFIVVCIVQVSFFSGAEIIFSSMCVSGYNVCEVVFVVGFFNHFNLETKREGIWPKKWGFWTDIHIENDNIAISIGCHTSTKLKIQDKRNLNWITNFTQHEEEAIKKKQCHDSNIVSKICS